MLDMEKIARVADARGLSLSAAKSLVERQEMADSHNARRACWNCGDPSGIRCCEFGRDVE